MQMIECRGELLTYVGWHIPCIPRLWEKLFRIQVHVFLSSGSCMNENVVFIDNIFRSLCSHFVGLSSPTHSLFIQKKSFFGKRQITWHYTVLAGLVQFVENFPRCSLMDRLLWCDRSQFRHLYFHEPIMVLIFLYSGQEPMVSAVASSIGRTELFPFLGGNLMKVGGIN